MTDADLFVVVKLVSGENVLCVLLDEDEEYLALESPMCIKSTFSFETGREHITAHPLCQFTDDKLFMIHRKDVMFCKKLDASFIPHYKRIVKEYDRTSVVPREDHLEWEDEEPKAKKKTTEGDLPSSDSFYVDGNETIN